MFCMFSIVRRHQMVLPSFLSQHHVFQIDLFRMCRSGSFRSLTAEMYSTACMYHNLFERTVLFLVSSLVDRILGWFPFFFLFCYITGLL